MIKFVKILKLKVQHINKTIRLHKAIQKIISLEIVLSLVLTVLPYKSAHATEPTVFVASANANHWGRSGLRSYLNNVTKFDNTLPLDSTTNGTNSANYPSHFSNKEYSLVQPYTYKTNILDFNRDAVAACEVTDKFWLPSSNYNNYKVISWGSEDISANAQYIKSTTNDKNRIIPISYWSCSPSTCSWTRSPDFSCYFYSLYARRGSNITDELVYRSIAPAAVFKIDLKSVTFASTASAANLASEGSESKRIEILGSLDFGKGIKSKLPDYGMYLKTASDDAFTPKSLFLNKTNLIVNYTDGKAGQYVVVQAFKEDNLTKTTASYVAAKVLKNGQDSINIDITEWKDFDGNPLTSLDGYTVKVWMEDDSESLAAATTPVTFFGANKTESGAVKNNRVFAMKEDLKISWGDLCALSNDDYSRVISGNAATELGTINGKDATNQKIYYGTYTDTNDENKVKPLEFWIAGRENPNHEIDSNGDIMTLYQANSVEAKKFDVSSSNYNVDGKSALALQLVESQTAEYTGSRAVYSSDLIIFKQGNMDLDKTLLKWKHRTPGFEMWHDGMPTNSGSYEICCYTEGTDNYEKTYSAVVNFTINPSSFLTLSKANHWGRSDLRAYLNNVSKTDNTLPINSAVSGSNTANYPSQFSKNEYGLVQAYTYKTNVIDENANATAVYETTDKFWLPSGNYNNCKVISWGSEDISTSTQYTKSIMNDKKRMIPISYWSYGESSSSWLRSPDYCYDYYTLRTYRGGCVINYGVSYSNASEAVFKIDLQSIIFASSASAAVLEERGEKIEIPGSLGFGKTC